MTEAGCVFCRIVAGDSSASVIWEDGEAMALMNLRAVNKGECMVIAKVHLDDLPPLTRAAESGRNDRV